MPGALDHSSACHVQNCTQDVTDYVRFITGLHTPVVVPGIVNVLVSRPSDRPCNSTGIGLSVCKNGRVPGSLPSFHNCAAPPSSIEFEASHDRGLDTGSYAMPRRPCAPSQTG
jgi:hypothetical protein